MESQLESCSFPTENRFENVLVGSFFFSREREREFIAWSPGWKIDCNCSAATVALAVDQSFRGGFCI